ncbi:hypothetical protein BDV59DRAFT_182926 [Aspergillus ambiguus]|uniref:uncharacterized protein n=1 Tax=Aspergillus ambiguus TaxID=176160 RepID=UPI003CCD48E6
MADYWQPPAAFRGPQLSHASSSAFGDLVYAFPRPRNAGRITKPRSAGNSPSSAGRRRAAVSQTSPRYQQPLAIQGYQYPFNAALLASAMCKKRAPRPISWHPASLASTEYLSPQCFPATMANNLAVMNLTPQQQPNLTPTSFGDFNMMPSYTTSDIPPSTDAFSGDMPDPFAMQQSSYLQTPMSWDTASSNVPAMTQPMPDGWAFDMMSMQNSMPSAEIPGSSYASVPSSGCLSGPSTPDFLPIQQPEPITKSLSEPAETGDELIGMGLYNHPETFPDHYAQGRPGKGLKLEETFTPSEDEADEKDAENENDNADMSEASSPIRPDVNRPFSQPTKPATSMMQKSFFFEDDEPEQPAAGYQQFFNLASQPCMSYGYGWL